MSGCQISSLAPSSGLQRPKSVKKEKIGLTGWDGVHDFLSFLLVINFEGEEILWSSQLELGSILLLGVFDDDFFSFWQVLLLSSHDLDEFLQVLDFLWLYRNK